MPTRDASAVRHDSAGFMPARSPAQYGGVLRQSWIRPGAGRHANALMRQNWPGRFCRPGRARTGQAGTQCRATGSFPGDFVSWPAGTAHAFSHPADPWCFGQTDRTPAACRPPLPSMMPELAPHPTRSPLRRARRVPRQHLEQLPRRLRTLVPHQPQPPPLVQQRAGRLSPLCWKPPAWRISRRRKLPSPASSPQKSSLRSPAQSP